MRELSIRQTPGRLEVFCEVLGLLDGVNDRLVDLLLVSCLRGREGLLRLGLALFEELFLSRLRALGGGLGEVGIVDLLVDLR
jgi:hypothetical protein